MAKSRIYGVTWSCPRCNRPFTSETEMLLHYLSCGKSKILSLKLKRQFI